jgi:DNA repair protein RadD
MTTPRQYQLDGIEQLREGIRRGHRKLLLVMLMGAGKTITSLEMMRNAVDKGSRCVFISDRRMLVDQAKKEAWEYGLWSTVIMAGRGTDPNAPIAFISKATLASWLEKGAIDKPEADLVFIEEAHRAASAQWLEIMKLWPKAIIVGLTATPCHSDGSGMGDIYQWLVQPVMPSQLMDMGCVVPLRYFAPHIPNLKGVRKGADGDYSQAALAKRMTRENLVGDVVNWWKKLGEDRPSVYYCCDKLHCATIQKEFTDAGIKAKTIIDETEDEERVAIREDILLGRAKVVVNCDVLCEGINWPELSCCGLLRPTKRFRRFLQMVGRVMRATPGKKDAIIIDHGGCVLYHGFADADIEWKLDREDCIDRRIQEAKEASPEKFPVTCENCHGMFVGRVCPHCGTPRKQFERKDTHKNKNGTLIEITRDMDLTPDALHTAQQRLWYSFIVAAIKRNLKAGVAAAMFKNRFGIPPWKTNVQPQTTNWQQPASQAFFSLDPKNRRKKPAEEEAGLFS